MVTSDGSQKDMNTTISHLVDFLCHDSRRVLDVLTGLRQFCILADGLADCSDVEHVVRLLLVLAV